MLLSWRPDRLGHATFLSDELKNEFFADSLQHDIGTTDPRTRAGDAQGRYKPCIEICLSSNLMWDTVQTLTPRAQLFFQMQNCTFP
jgi:adenosine deaminase